MMSSLSKREKTRWNPLSLRKRSLERVAGSVGQVWLRALGSGLLSHPLRTPSPLPGVKGPAATTCNPLSLRAAVGKRRRVGDPDGPPVAAVGDRARLRRDAGRSLRECLAPISQFFSSGLSGSLLPYVIR